MMPSLQLSSTRYSLHFPITDNSKLTTERMRVAIKIGSNVLTRPNGTLDITRVSAIVDQVCSLRNAGIETVLISSGAVACGRGECHDVDTSRLDNVSQRQFFSAIGQVKLINRYYDLFHDHGVKIGQVLTMKESFSTRRHYLNQRNCMLVMMEAGVIPIVNENDTISVTELMFTDNDELSGLIATMLDCDSLVILSNIDGIYDGDPRNPNSRLIPLVSREDELSSVIVSERSGFGRGGMVTKHRIARKVSDEGIEVIIANGRRDNILTSLLLDKNPETPCTRFIPSGSPASSMKRWIAHSEGFVKGVVRINDKAAILLTSPKAASLLPVGVTEIEGDFEKDDLVQVVDPSGISIGIGRVSCNSNDARRQIGMHGCKPLIHYDYLYIE